MAMMALTVINETQTQAQTSTLTLVSESVSNAFHMAAIKTAAVWFPVLVSPMPLTRSMTRD
jgi:hypothetical protein